MQHALKAGVFHLLDVNDLKMMQGRKGTNGLDSLYHQKGILNDKLTLCDFNQITTSEQRRILRCFTSECSL